MMTETRYTQCHSCYKAVPYSFPADAEFDATGAVDIQAKCPHCPATARVKVIRQPSYVY